MPPEVERELAAALGQLVGAFSVECFAPGTAGSYHVAVYGVLGHAGAVAARREAPDGTRRELRVVPASENVLAGQAAILGEELLDAMAARDLTARRRLAAEARLIQGLRPGSVLLVGPGGQLEDAHGVEMMELRDLELLRPAGPPAIAAGMGTLAACVNWRRGVGGSELLMRDGAPTARVTVVPCFIRDALADTPCRIATRIELLPLGRAGRDVDRLTAFASDFPADDRAALASLLEDAPLDAIARKRLRGLRKRLDVPSNLALRAFLRRLI
ncbi:hypothetical protein [Jannaschia sp. LMIT008]|uniref:hypothetical protein n=1 Tax=Jannaschia maritima TaxID=3032585 RepID=UPI00281130C8|nr:hypothetical protein [Jannaschia sp. LMIT008]